MKCRFIGREKGAGKLVAGFSGLWAGGSETGRINPAVRFWKNGLRLGGESLSQAVWQSTGDGDLGGSRLLRGGKRRSSGNVTGVLKECGDKSVPTP